MKDQSNFSLTFSRSSRFEEFLGCRVVIGLDLVPIAVTALLLASASADLGVAGADFFAPALQKWEWMNEWVNELEETLLYYYNSNGGWLIPFPPSSTGRMGTFGFVLLDWIRPVVGLENKQICEDNECENQLSLSIDYQTWPRKTNHSVIRGKWSLNGEGKLWEQWAFNMK